MPFFLTHLCSVSMLTVCSEIFLHFNPELFSFNHKSNMLLNTSMVFQSCLCMMSKLTTSSVWVPDNSDNWLRWFVHEALQSNNLI